MGGANGSRECAPDDKLRDTINCILWRRKPNPSVLRTGIGRDDLIDACVCAVAVRDSTWRLGGDEVDINGVQMEINC
jgi:hypothetical protein